MPCHDGRRWTLDHSAIRAAPCSGVTFIEGDGQLRVLFSHAMPWWQEVGIGPLSYQGSPLLRGHLYWRWWPTKSAVFPCHAMMAGGRHWTTQLSGQPPAQGSPLLKVMGQLRVLFSRAMPMMVGDRHECYDAWEAAMAKGITVGELPRPICLIKNRPKTLSVEIENTVIWMII